MIQDFDITRLVPKFILADSTGYAMAKAIEAGLAYFLDRCQEGIDTIQNVDEMPEWRLDEMAWEYNCVYDYGAEIDVKRDLIASAYYRNRKHGTAEGIRQYLLSAFDAADVEEWWEFGGDPGLFNVVVTGVRTDQSTAWIRKSVRRAKNVRSDLNEVIYGDNVELQMGYRTAPTSIAVDAYTDADDARRLLVGDIEKYTVAAVQRIGVRRLQK